MQMMYLSFATKGAGFSCTPADAGRGRLSVWHSLRVLFAVFAWWEEGKKREKRATGRDGKTQTQTVAELGLFSVGSTIDPRLYLRLAVKGGIF